MILGSRPPFSRARRGFWGEGLEGVREERKRERGEVRKQGWLWGFLLALRAVIE